MRHESPETRERAMPGPAGRTGATVMASLVLLFAVAGCGGGNDSGGNGNAIVTGSAKCDQASMQRAVGNWAKAYGGGEKASLPDSDGSYRCADGWAVAFPDLGSGNTAVTVTAVFEAEGQFWIPKDRTKVCGKTAADSEVPESLFEEACQTN